MKTSTLHILLAVFSFFITLSFSQVKKQVSFTPEKFEAILFDSSDEHFSAEIVLDPLRDRYIILIEGVGTKTKEAKATFEHFLETGIKDMIVTINSKEKISVWKVIRETKKPQTSSGRITPEMMQLLFSGPWSHN
ncbi:MAG: hypothetical protein WCO58_00300 [bacterium]